MKQLMYAMVMVAAAVGGAVAQAPSARQILEEMYAAQAAIKDVQMHVSQEVRMDPEKPPLTTEMDLKMIVDGPSWVRSVVRGEPRMPQMTTETAIHDNWIFTKTSIPKQPPQLQKIDAARVPGINLKEMRRAPFQNPGMGQALVAIKSVASLQGQADLTGDTCWVIEFPATDEVIKALMGSSHMPVSDQELAGIRQLAKSFRLYVDRQSHLLRRLEMYDHQGKVWLAVTLSQIRPNIGLTAGDCLIDAPVDQFQDMTETMLKQAQGQPASQQQRMQPQRSSHPAPPQPRQQPPSQLVPPDQYRH